MSEHLIFVCFQELEPPWQLDEHEHEREAREENVESPTCRILGSVVVHSDRCNSFDKWLEELGAAHTW